MPSSYERSWFRFFPHFFWSKDLNPGLCSSSPNQQAVNVQGRSVSLVLKVSYFILNTCYLLGKALETEYSGCVFCLVSSCFLTQEGRLCALQEFCANVLSPLDSGSVTSCPSKKCLGSLGQVLLLCALFLQASLWGANKKAAGPRKPANALLHVMELCFLSCLYCHLYKKQGLPLRIGLAVEHISINAIGAENSKGFISIGRGRGNPAAIEFNS